MFIHRITLLVDIRNRIEPSIVIQIRTYEKAHVKWRGKLLLSGDIRQTLFRFKPIFSPVNRPAFEETRKIPFNGKISLHISYLC